MNAIFRVSQFKCTNCSSNLTGTIRRCYSCKNELTGSRKNQHEDWECMCDEYQCKCSKNDFFCPICNKYHQESNHLAEVIENENTRWLANMITHYRHSHITSWNKMWGDGGSDYQRAAKFGDYDEEKMKVNERAKRQILRKCTEYILSNGITKEHFLMLENTSEDTIKLMEKIFKPSLLK